MSPLLLLLRTNWVLQWWFRGIEVRLTTLIKYLYLGQHMLKFCDPLNSMLNVPGKFCYLILVYLRLKMAPVLIIGKDTCLSSRSTVWRTCFRKRVFEWLCFIAALEAFRGSWFFKCNCTSTAKVIKLSSVHYPADFYTEFKMDFSLLNTG